LQNGVAEQNLEASSSLA